MPTPLLFAREEGLRGITSYAVVLVHSERSNDPDVLIDHIEKSVTDWVERTDEGRALWKDSCEDLNIGDLACQGITSELEQCLAAEGIRLEFVAVNEGGYFNYDRILARPELGERE